MAPAGRCISEPQKTVKLTPDPASRGTALNPPALRGPGQICQTVGPPGRDASADPSCPQVAGPRKSRIDLDNRFHAPWAAPSSARGLRQAAARGRAWCQPAAWRLSTPPAKPRRSWCQRTNSAQRSDGLGRWCIQYQFIPLARLGMAALHILGGVISQVRLTFSGLLEAPWTPFWMGDETLLRSMVTRVPEASTRPTDFPGRNNGNSVSRFCYPPDQHEKSVATLPCAAIFTCASGHFPGSFTPPATG